MENLTANQNNSADIISDNAEKSQEVREDVVQAAIDKIMTQAESASGQNVPIVAIYNHLIAKCKDSRHFAEAVLKEEKTINQCCKYVTDRAFLAATKQNLTATPTNNDPLCYGMDSAEIFKLSDEYFELEDDALEKLKDAERTIIDDARKAIDTARQEAEKKKAEERKKAQAEKEKAKKEKEEKKAQAEEAAQAQMSLLD